MLLLLTIIITTNMVESELFTVQENLYCIEI